MQRTKQHEQDGVQEGNEQSTAARTEQHEHYEGRRAAVRSKVQRCAAACDGGRGEPLKMQWRAAAVSEWEFQRGLG